MLVQLSTEPIQPLQFDKEGLATSNRGYYVYVTEACNLRCNYCFVDDKHNHNHLFDPITYEREADKEDMVLKVAEFIVNDPQGHSSKYVHFFGGEPLIRVKSIDRFVNLLKAMLALTLPQCKITFGITTNGTLLTEEACQILKKHGVGVQLSLDGSEEGNDVHRQLMGGSQQGGNIGAGDGEGLAKRAAGAFHMVKVDNYLKHFGSNARMTLTPGNLKFLLKSIQELNKLGFKSFSVIPNTDSGEWDNHWQGLEMAYEEVFTYAMESGITVNLVDHAMRKLLTREFKPQGHLCQAGRNVVGISVGGALWPCHDFLGKFQKDPTAVNALQIGHISKGYTLNTEKFEHLECNDEIKSGAGFDCKTCHAAPMCERGCPYINYAQHQNVKEVNATYCRSTRIMADITLRYMLRHPEKFVVDRVGTGAQVQQVDDPRIAIALQVFQQEAPFGRNEAGQALLPGYGRATRMGLKPSVVAAIGSVSAPSAGQASGPVKSINGPREPQEPDEAAGWDGERGFPSPITSSPSGNTMHMVATPQTGLGARQ